MALVIGVVSQKGGVGKSTLARLIACNYAASEWRVKIADMDLAQGTCTSWNRRRLQNEIEPKVAVEQFLNVDDAIKTGEQYDLVVFDGAPHSTRKTLDIADACDLLILPTGVSLDDLEPTIKLAHELKKHGIYPPKISIALTRAGNSDVELAEGMEYVRSSGYHLLDGVIHEKTAIRRASDEGKCATETSFKSINEKVDQLVQAIVNRADELGKK
ncbi:MAG: ParA family protein [Lewinellaceae bacterium]|nr:ParA family protein [Saprospiraceae bacterium]MCB9341867.1 ParA family protein [Lewinellaceae bacterium]